MLDPKLLRDQPEQVAGLLKRRGFVLDVDKFRTLDQRRRALETQMQQLLAERKQAARLIGAKVRSGMSPEEARKSVEADDRGREERLEALRAETNAAAQALEEFCLELPNVPDPEVPPGQGEEDNLELARWGTPRPATESTMDHVQLGAAGRGLDFEAALPIAGSRFLVMRGAMARLQRALIQFMMDVHTREHGYEEVYVPYLIDAQCLVGTGQLPKFEEDLFAIAGAERRYLLPTAEVPVTNLLRDTIVEIGGRNSGQSLPLKLVCHSPCFRSEAGSHGKDTRGMIRQHQFEKVELVQFATAGQARDALEELTGHAEAILRRLELPHRKVLLCGADLGFAACRTYDLEVWVPSQNRYREISSCSHFGDFQARRIKARWRDKPGTPTRHLHTLNGSGLAVGRTLVALLENHQDSQGRIAVPEPLRPYLDGMTKLGGEP